MMRRETNMEFKIEKLDILQGDLPGFADNVTVGVAGKIVEEIAAGWSAESPSAEGEAPAIDSGALAKSIITQPGEVGRMQVGSSSDHGAILEFGTRKMVPKSFQQMKAELVV
jgi:hypothetical protein